MTVRTLVIALACLAVTGCGLSGEDQSAEVTVIEERAGQGQVATEGARVAIHYTGWVYDRDAPQYKGEQFDSSRKQGRPLSFVIGTGQVIEGLEQGVIGMREGGRKTLLIPAELGYGNTDAGSAIPPNSPLIFEVELIDVM